MEERRNIPGVPDYTVEMLAEKRSDCDALRSAARERLPAAVELIVGRVVSI